MGRRPKVIYTKRKQVTPSIVACIPIGESRLAAGSDFLHGFCERLWQRLGSHHRSVIQAYFGGKFSQDDSGILDSISTMCSGIDCIVSCADVLANIMGTGELKHTFSAEANEDKREFLKTFFPSIFISD